MWYTRLFVPCRDVDSAFVDNKWWGCISSSTDALDDCNPLTVAWLNQFWSSASLRAYYNFYRANNTHLEACLIEVVYIVVVDPIPRFCLTYESKLRADNLGIFLEYSLPVLRSIEGHFELS